MALNLFKRLNFISAAFVFSIASSTASAIGTPNQNVKYVGYDWATPEKLSMVKHNTNLNVVNTFSELQSDYCLNNRCALAIGAGRGEVERGLGRLDICFEALSYAECSDINRFRLSPVDSVYRNSWQQIWHYVEVISSIDEANIPTAIYFIDEPDLNKSLRTNDEYQRYSYSSYVCTLRQALDYYGNTRDIKIFTSLSTSVNSGSNIVLDVKNQMNPSGCGGGKSTLDWVGINNYFWTSPHDIHEKFVNVFGLDNDLKWILFAPTTQEYKIKEHVNDPDTALLVWTPGEPRPKPSDDDLKVRLQAFWDYLVFYPNDPVIYLMHFKLDNTVSNMNEPGQGEYSGSRDLINYMSNRLLP